MPAYRYERLPESTVIRILLVEETGLWRKALATFLSAQDDFDVVAELAHARDAVSLAVTARPDVVMVDIGPLTEDEQAAVGREIARFPLDCAVVLLADPALPAAVRGLLGPHISGLFSKDSGPDALARCIRRTAAGERVIDPTLAVGALCGPANPLTAREREVLRVAASGVPSREIAACLHLSVGTVRNYLSVIMQKVGGRNRMEACRAAESAGWL
jgi:two-component system response regulator DesR